MATLERLEAFIARWRGSLESCAKVTFRIAEQRDRKGAAADVADAFVRDCGFAPIGHHWEMLDICAGSKEPRSSQGAFEDALSMDLAMRREWLGEEQAGACGQDFIAAFDPVFATILTNHIIRDGGRSEGWNPITAATFEWAFVGMDDAAIALLLVTAED